MKKRGLYLLSFITSFEDWVHWSERYNIMPCIARIPLASSRVAQWKKAWKSPYASEYSVLLESGKGGRYSCLALRPVSVIKGKDPLFRVYETDEHGHMTESSAINAKPLDAVKHWMAEYRMPTMPNAPDTFIGGAVGYWSYDVIRSLEKLPSLAADDLDVPDIVFMRFHEVWIIDHEEGELYCSYLTDISLHHTCKPRHDEADDRSKLFDLYELAVARVQNMMRIWERIHDAQSIDAGERRQARFEQCKANEHAISDEHDSAAIASGDVFTRQRFIEAVERIQAYIRQGDVYQVNLSLRQSRRLRQSSDEIYEWLRLVNPSPYMSYLRFPEFHVVCGSPELLVKLSGGKVSTKPIAGTRRRGTDELEDQRLIAELQDNEKERAEHIMLVDLLRNDIGRIASYGTVAVEELMAVESYSHVMHLVSTVSGELAEGKTPYDVIQAMFPGGTITGAPKIRTMEIIEELEPVRRGLYTGSIGWIDYNGNMEFNIVIRTMVVKDGTGYIQAGAGIVTDSVPEREYKESINKARALWKAILWSELEG